MTKNAEKIAEQQQCWEWSLMTTNRNGTTTSVAMARRDVAMTYAWLRGARLADLGRQHGISGTRVKSACVRVVWQARKALHPDRRQHQHLGFTPAQGLASLEAAERAFNDQDQPTP